ncbi:MAG UNVERIFIED_CONTAM: hypothetical protein LVR29_30380 [Microcystis novacekii LVE1205-3]
MTGKLQAPSVDYRLTAEVCQELDAIERKNWRDYVQQEGRSRNRPIDYRQPAHIDRGNGSAAETSDCFGEIERSLLILAVAVLDI